MHPVGDSLSYFIRIPGVPFNGPFSFAPLFQQENFIL